MTVGITVTVYTTGADCIRCTMTKRSLVKYGLSYREVDIRTHPDVAAYITDDLGYSEAPVCIVEDGTGEHHWSGHRPDLLKNLAMTNRRSIQSQPGSVQS